MTRSNNVTVDQAIDTLMLFVDAFDPIGATETARLLSIPTSTAFRLLTTLEAVGYLERGEHGTFRLGINAKEVGLAALSRFGIAKVASSTLAELATLTRQTVSLHVRVGDQVVRVAGRESASPVGAALRLGEERPCLETPMGLLLLAFGPAAQRRGMLSGRRLTALKEQAFLVTVDDTPARVKSLAWPVLGPDQTVVCVLAVEGPEFQFDTSEGLYESVRTLTSDLEQQVRAAPHLAALPYDHVDLGESPTSP